MSNEEFERRMTFIVDQQAQFTVDIQQLRETQAEAGNIVARLAHVTLEGFKDVNSKIDALVDSELRLNESHARLADSQAKTDEKLRNLMSVVDRYFERRNGN